MRFLIVVGLVLCCGCSQGFKEPTESIDYLSASQASAGISRCRASTLNLSGLTWIDKHVARELAKYKPYPENFGCFDFLYLDGLTSIDKDVAYELGVSERGCLLMA